MRTKALFCAAALAATGLAASAQTYSLNVVGYINKYFTNGYTLMGNQLDLDGTMTNNTLMSVLGTNLPTLSKFLTYTKASGYVTALYSGGNWSGSTNVCNAMLSPGYGGYVYIRPTATPATVTMVGQVIQGTNSIPLGTGYSIVSSIAPLAGGVETTLGLTGHTLDKVLTFSPQTGFTAYLWSSANTNWGAVEPTVNVGDAFFYYARSATNAWNQTFIVQ